MAIIQYSHAKKLVVMPCMGFVIDQQCLATGVFQLIWKLKNLIPTHGKGYGKI